MVTIGVERVKEAYITAMKKTRSALESNRLIAPGNLLMAILLAILTSGCANRAILDADFDAFANNTTDAGFEGELEGPPEGDSIEHPVIGSLSIQTNGPAGGGNNLRIIKGTIGNPAFISFKLADHELPDEYRIIWKGAPEPSQQTEVLFLDESGREAVRVFLSSAGLPSLTLPLGGGNSKQIDINPTASHEIIVKIKPQNNLGGVIYKGLPNERVINDFQLRDPNFKKLKYVRFVGWSFDGAYNLSFVISYAKFN